MLLKNGIKIFLWIWSICFISGSQAKVLTVGINQEFNHIKSAVISASVNDTIYIKSGTYREGNILISIPITIIGENFPVVDGQDKYENITVQSDNVLITGLRLINSGVSFIDDNAAIKLDEVKNCTITNNQFEKNFFAIYLAKSSYCEISENKITSVKTSEAKSGNGIHLWYCKKIKIRDNYITGHRDGIYFEFVQSSLITGNISEDNLRYGLHFMFSDSCRYSKNIFKHNGAGVAVMFTHQIEMTDNRFENNWGGASYGILLKDITDSRIENNHFYKNSSGIYIEGSNRISISNNDFIENGWAIRLMANSMDNIFIQNNFIGNSFDVATNSVKNHNIFNNNYWSEYSGYDLNRDGIGDIPYRPVKLFSLIVEKNRPTLILLRSMFVDILDAAEKMFPALTPETLIDGSPSMKRVL